VLVDTGNATIDSTLVATGDTTNATMAASNTTNNSVMLATSSNNATTEAACRNNVVGIIQVLHECSIAETPISFECDIGKLWYKHTTSFQRTKIQTFDL